MLRAVILARAGRVNLVHVRAHTGGTGFLARMNDRADAVANRVRCEWLGRSRELPLYLYAESRCRLSVEGVPVVGAYKPAIKRAVEDRRETVWATRSRCARPGCAYPAGLAPPDPTVRHSSRLVWANGSGVMSMCKEVQRTHDPFLLRFWSLLVAEWLPVERRLAVSRRDGGRGDLCRLCGTGPETVRHLFGCLCPALRSCRREAVTGCSALLRGAGVRVVISDGLPQPPIPVAQPKPEIQGFAQWAPAWYDPTSRTWLLVFAHVSVSPASLFGSGRDPLADAVGVLPDRLERLLSWQLDGATWVRRDLRQAALLRGRARMVLLRGAYRLYCARCRLVGQWWRSERAAPHRAAVAAVREAASARRAMRKELRLVAVYVLRQRKKRPGDCRRGMGCPGRPARGGVVGPRGSRALLSDSRPWWTRRKLLGRRMGPGVLGLGRV